MRNQNTASLVPKPVAKEKNCESYTSQPSKTQSRKLAELIVGKHKGSTAASGTSTSAAKTNNQARHLLIQEEDYMGDEDDRDAERCRPRQSLSPTTGFQKHDSGKMTIKTPTK